MSGHQTLVPATRIIIRIVWCSYRNICITCLFPFTLTFTKVINNRWSSATFHNHLCNAYHARDGICWWRNVFIIMQQYRYQLIILNRSIHLGTCYFMCTFLYFRFVISPQYFVWQTILSNHKKVQCGSNVTGLRAKPFDLMMPFSRPCSSLFFDKSHSVEMCCITHFTCPYVYL